MSEVASDSRSALKMEETRFDQRGDVELHEGSGIHNILGSRHEQEVDKATFCFYFKISNAQVIEEQYKKM